jgi:phosphatidylserine/phosphatidylglycerophosphate/cardiolipin synthase-like enzyme
MNVLIQPNDGIENLLQGIRSARQSIEVTIYRLDILEIEMELIAAARRGVDVHVLISYTGRGNVHRLEKLCKRLRKAGATISQTADDFLRYHYKVMIVDRRLLYLLTFNFTFLDIHHSRSFGVITDEQEMVDEAVALFEADAAQKSYLSDHDRLVISPHNSRRQLCDFIRQTQHQLLIYDEKVQDEKVLRLLEERAQAGIEIKVIGRTGRPIRKVTVRPVQELYLHAQAIIRDGTHAFVGSQSLRKKELDRRRELGIIFESQHLVRSLSTVFEMDWGDMIARNGAAKG